MTDNSIMNYEYRDPTYSWKVEERVKLSIKVLLWVLIVAGFVTILHLTVEPKLPRAEAKRVDDSVICSHVSEYPIEQHGAIIKYCVDLQKRGL